jgi:hypothetical protein
MKQLTTVLVATFLLAGVWIALQTKFNMEKTYVFKNVLEISAPINGRIDTQFLDKL